MSRYVPASETLGRGLVVWLGPPLRRVLLIALPVAALLWLTVELTTRALDTQDDAVTHSDALVLSVLTFGLTLGSALLAPAVHGALGHARSQSLRSALRHLLTRGPTAALTALLVIAPVALAGHGIVFATALDVGFEALIVLGLISGALLLLALWCVPHWLAPQAAMLDGLGPLESLRRSRTLLRGEWVTGAGILLAIAGVLFGLTVLAAVPLTHLDLSSATEELLEPFWLTAVMTLWIALAGSVAATAHHDLALRRDGEGLEGVIELLQ